MNYTLTYQRALNFGAVLQAYALARCLNEQGYDTEVIDYLPNYMHWQTKRPTKSIKGTIEKFKKYRKFAQFRREFMPMTDKTYYSKNALLNLPNVESVIVGSDQVWNPNLHGQSKSQGDFDMAYLLSLPFSDANSQSAEKPLPSQVKKIGYAVSAGTVRFKDILTDDVKQAVTDFTAVGCREHSLYEDILPIRNKPTKVVLDPSLLISDYSAVLIDGLTPETDYIVSYVVGSGAMLESFEQRVLEAKEQLGLPIIHIGAKKINNADQNILDIGPREWLTYIKNAKFVLTNSFHGCAFSLNFNKQFIAIPHKYPELNQRQKSLLAGVGLSHKMLDDNEPLSTENLATIDYAEANEKLRGLVSQSKQFLIDSVKG